MEYPRPIDRIPMTNPVDYRLPARANIPTMERAPPSKSLVCTIHPLIQELRDRYRSINGRSSAVDEFRIAFDVADRNSPGITDTFVAELLGSLLGDTLPWNQVEVAIQKTKRPNTDYTYGRMT
jgi:hypothetical protein